MLNITLEISTTQSLVRVSEPATYKEGDTNCVAIESRIPLRAGYADDQLKEWTECDMETHRENLENINIGSVRYCPRHHLFTMSYMVRDYSRRIYSCHYPIVRSVYMVL